MDISFDLSNVVVGIITLAAVYLGNRTAHTSLNRGKTWDIKREAYGTIVSELASVESRLDLADEYIAEDLMRYFEDDTEDRKFINEKMKKVRKSFLDNYLIMSDDFIEIYESFMKNLDGIDDDMIPPEAYDHFSAAVRKYRPLLLQQARQEIAR